MVSNDDSNGVCLDDLLFSLMVFFKLLSFMHAAHRSKITKKVHKPPRNHYIEWPVFSDIGLNCESQGEKGRTCKK